MKIYSNLFDQIISPENLFSAWDAFKGDKRRKPDVMRFEWRLEENIFELHRELKNKTYQHGPYSGFHITDPKQRHIHKASVCDRVLHHAVFSVINPIFEKSFIANSFSCRIGKGTHRGVLAAENMIRGEGRNYTRPCFALKCDVRKFFDSVDHGILVSIFKKRIKDDDAMWLLEAIIGSYARKPRERERERVNLAVANKGVPIGNLTSQLFANIYLNEFDQFVKHELRIKQYVRYTDDFILMADNREYLEHLLKPICIFLRSELALELHPKKITIRSLRQGVDFLGYVILPHYRLLRSKTKRRMFRKLKARVKQFRLGDINEPVLSQSLQSYLGVLSHAHAYQLSQYLKNQYWYWICQ